MEESFKEVAKMYGEPAAKPEELFSIFASFSDMFMVCSVSLLLLYALTPSIPESKS